MGVKEAGKAYEAKNIIHNDVRSGIGKAENANKANTTIEINDIKITDNESSLKRLLEFSESKLDNEVSRFWGYVNCLNEDNETEYVEVENNIDDWLEEEDIINKCMIRNLREKIQNCDKYIESSIYEIENINVEIDSILKIIRKLMNAIINKKGNPIIKRTEIQKIRRVLEMAC